MAIADEIKPFLEVEQKFLRYLDPIIVGYKTIIDKTTKEQGKLISMDKIRSILTFLDIIKSKLVANSPALFNTKITLLENRKQELYSFANATYKQALAVFRSTQA